VNVSSLSTKMGKKWGCFHGKVDVRACKYTTMKHDSNKKS